MINVTVGEASIRIEAIEFRNSIDVVSQHYDLDALLHAVQRTISAANGSCSEVQHLLDTARKHLAAHRDGQASCQRGPL